MGHNPESLTAHCVQLQHHGGPQVDLLALAYNDMLNLEPWKTLVPEHLLGEYKGQFWTYLMGKDPETGAMVTKTLGIGDGGWTKVSRAIKSLGDERPHGIDRTGIQIHDKMMELLEKAGLWVGEHGGDHGNQHTGGKHDNITVARPDGTSRNEAIRRLRKRDPELLAQVEAGKLSAHAAMVEAGFRPRTVSVRIADPASVAKTLQKYMTPDDLEALKDLL